MPSLMYTTSMCFLILQKCFKISKTIFFHLAPFRRGFPTNKQIHRLNQNALVSLSNDNITKEKIEINIIANPNTTFLAPRNSTVNTVNNFVIDVLFSNQTPLMTITNGLQDPMMVYRNMTVIITENRLAIFYLILLQLIVITTIDLYSISEYPQFLLSYSSSVFIKYLETGFITKWLASPIYYSYNIFTTLQTLNYVFNDLTLSFVVTQSITFIIPY